MFGTELIEFSENENIRKKLASKYIRGNGIEIGALHQPLEVPPNVNVQYVDRLTDEMILNHYPEIANHGITSPDIIDDAEKLEKIEDNTFDFCIANHVLEHMRDPIGSILSWIRVVKPGGIVIISVPDIENPLDSGRCITETEHFIKDYEDINEDLDYQHEIASSSYRKKYSTHYHTFTRESLDKLFSFIATRENELFKIVETCNNITDGVPEYIYIIEKDSHAKAILDFLVSSSGKYKEGIDVIVPIYNAYEDFVKCLFSLLSNYSGYRIILINDKSSDERIENFLEQLKKFDKDFLVVLENEQNFGFVKTANKGMKFSQNDVILLNSDTIVTPGWSDKIRDYAYSDIKIATVTPLTNNGTICSVPIFLQENEIPEGFTIDSFAAMIEEISLQQIIEIPTAVGFCIFIKRETLNKIGYFDEIFGKGYSEENDFSRRAVKYGYINIACDNTFIYHRGSSSFSATLKAELYEHNLNLLSNRYPDYLMSVAQFCSSNPFRNIQNNIELRMRTYDYKKRKIRVLIVLHTLGGGTLKYVLDIIKALKTNYIFYILQVSAGKIILEEINNWRSLHYSFPLGHSCVSGITYDERYAEVVKKLIISFDINIIHIHHLFGQPLNIFSIADELQIPLLMTIHDYYILCPSIFLVNEDRNYCSDINDLNRCNRCLSFKQGRPKDYIIEWREHWEKALKSVTKFIVNNQAVVEIINNCHSIPPQKFEIIEPGHSNELIEISQKRVMRHLHKPVCFAYIGILERSHKGMDMFYALANSSRLKQITKWKLIGISELHEKPGIYPEYNTEVYGFFKDYNDLSYALKDVDIVIHPGPCETFSYTVSEAWANGIPVLGANSGVVKTRIELTDGGWVVDMCNQEKVEDRILQIIQNENDYKNKVESILKIQLNTMDSFKKAYHHLYRSLPIESIEKKGNGYSNIDLFKSLSNSEIRDSIINNAILPDPNHNLPLYHRFFKCLQENGFMFTIKRIIIFTKKYFPLIVNR